MWRLQPNIGREEFRFDIHEFTERSGLFCSLAVQDLYDKVNYKQNNELNLDKFKSVIHIDRVDL